MYRRFAEEDRDNAIRNLITGIGYGGPSYNAVISAVFSNEGEESVSLDEAKQWCRIDGDSEDLIIESLISAAREMCETFVNLSLISRTVTATLFNGDGGINLPYGPVVGDVVYTDSEDAVIEDYNINSGDSDNVTATYNAGYGADPGYTVLPNRLKTAILNQIAFLYSNRGDDLNGQSISSITKHILKPLRKE